MEIAYQAWLHYQKIKDGQLLREYRSWCANLVCRSAATPILSTAQTELLVGLRNLLGLEPVVTTTPSSQRYIVVKTFDNYALSDWGGAPDETERFNREGFLIKTARQKGTEYIMIAAVSDRGILYGVFHFLRLLQTYQTIDRLNIREAPVNPLRMINHWDNLDGSVERGYAGKSIYFENNQFTANRSRLRDYARLLASIGINGVVINNVNVHQEETRLIADKLALVVNAAAIFRDFGIKIYLSVNFAAPIQLGDLETADPLDEGVKQWWRVKTARLYQQIPDLGGFLVKADSEHQPGPYTYNRNHAEGANLLAEALQSFGGIVIWRCFVYNCGQDWRDRTTDRAKAAYDNFKPLDGKFAANVILQVKNGPMDFQVREPLSPLFGAMHHTNQMLELQITQEYTGQQVHLCYLIPQWKEILDFETYACGAGSTVKRVVAGSLFNQQNCGCAAVANIGTDRNWTGHPLAQANLFGYARLAWNPDLTDVEITTEWVRSTYGNDPEVVATIKRMLLDSWRIYENYNAPLGIGWMVNPNDHYGPNVDGYEYSQWGTYHRADSVGIGIDRSVVSGTGYAGQYLGPNATRYETPDTCPDELLLFFHHVPYTPMLKSGKTVIQHIYDTHFTGVEQVRELITSWEELQDKLNPQLFAAVLERLKQQLEHAVEWRDVINTYFYRKSGIKDEFDRKIY
jgi:alpha-glucuronidase